MDSSLFFSNALMDMYAKCGSIETKKFILNSSRTLLNIYGNCKASRRHLRPYLDAHYPLTHHSILITYHLKYPNFLKVACLAHCFQLLITQKVYFLWDPYLSTMLVSSVSLPASHSFHFILFTAHFILLFPFNPIALPKPKTNPVKIEQAWTYGANLHRHLGHLPRAHRHPVQLDLLRRVAAMPIFSIVT